MQLVRFRKLLGIILFGLIVFGLLSHLAGLDKSLSAFRQAKIFYIIMVLLAEFLFYLFIAILNWVILLILGYRLSIVEVFGIAWASAFANRILSVGGVSGVWARFHFLTRRGVTKSAVGITIAIHNIVGLGTLLITFLFGLIYHFHYRGLTSREILASGTLVIGVGILLGVLFYLIANRKKLEKILFFFLRSINSLRARYQKKLWSVENLKSKIDQFYQEIFLLSQNRFKLSTISVLGFLSLGCDLFALYFSFRAVGYSIPLGVMVLGYAVSNYLAGLSMLPGGLGVMEVSLTAIFTGLQIPFSIAVAAVIIYRFFSFWFPIPMGGLAYWRLEKRSAYEGYNFGKNLNHKTKYDTIQWK